jgi:hypothetical protein
MADEQDNPRIVPVMREDRPLDALLPELSGGFAPSAATDGAGPAFHPGVLVVEVDSGYEWSFACWRDPGGAQQLAKELERMMEAVLLARLSEPLSKNPPEKPFRAMRLFLYDEVEGADEVLAEMGYQEVPFRADEYRDRSMKFTEQARQAGWAVSDQPASVWRADVVFPDDELMRRTESIAKAMREEIGDLKWGDQPGKYSHVMAEELHKQYRVGVSPNLESLDHIDLLLIDHTEQRLRWMPPAVFQGLCDFLAVVAHATTPAQIQWGVSTTDASGFTSPPLLRVKRNDTTSDVPIARRLLHWAVMPMKRGTDDRLLRRFEEAFAFVTR